MKGTLSNTRPKPILGPNTGKQKAPPRTEGPSSIFLLMKLYTDQKTLYAAAAATAVAAISLLALYSKPKKVLRLPASVDVTLTDEELIKQGFAAKRIPQDIDVIVIGSGLSALSVAATLAKEGKRVLVLEQHDVAGGNTHTFEEKGYEFDTGFHYIGGHLDNKTYPTRKVFDYLSNGRIEFQRLGDVVDVAVTEDENGKRDEVHFLADHAPFKEYLKKRFPDEHKAIDKYFETVRIANRSSGIYFGLQMCPTWARGLYRWWNASKFECMRKTVLEVVSSITSNKELIGILNYSWGDFGDPPSRAAFYLNAAILSHYRGGAYYAIGGPSVITKTIVRTIEELGGKVLVRAPVSSILVNDSGAAIGVNVKGKDIFAKTIISSIGAPQTYSKLIPDSHRHLVAAQIQELANPDLQSCCSLMSLFIGFKGDAEELGLPTYNVWKFPSWDHETNFEVNKKSPEAPFCALFMSFSSAKDPTYATRYPGRQVGLVVAPSFFEHVEKFKDGRVKHRGDEYEKMKEAWKDRLIAAFLKEFPKVSRDSIEVAEIGTAITNDYYLGTHRGAIYGLAHTPARYASNVVNPRTPIANLYLTGQDILSCGIVGAAYSGLMTAAIVDSIEGGAISASVALSVHVVLQEISNNNWNFEQLEFASCVFPSRAEGALNRLKESWSTRTHVGDSTAFPTIQISSQTVVEAKVHIPDKHFQIILQFMEFYTQGSSLYATATAVAVVAASWLALYGKQNESHRLTLSSSRVDLYKIPDDDLIKKGFAAKKVPEDIDVIIIGSGMSGLAAAVALAKEGKRVLVLEQHDVAGGNTHTFQEKGYEFDTGFHYIGGKLDDKKHSNRKLFDYLSDQRLEFQRLGDIVDVAVVEGEDGVRDEVPFLADMAKFKEYLKKRFPDEHKAIDAFFDTVNVANRSIGAYFGLQMCPTWARGIYRWLNASKLKYMQKTTMEVVSSFTKNKELMGIFNYSWGDIGEPPTRAAFYINAAILSHTEAIVRTIEEYGGKVLVRAPVSSILIDESITAVGVLVKGKQIFAKTVISTIGAPQTYNKLVPEAHCHRVATQIKELANSSLQPCCSAMSLFIGFKGDAKELALPTHNIWKFPSWEHDANFEAAKISPDAPFSALFMSFSSAKDPTYASRCPGKQNGLVVAASFFEHVEKFKDGRVKHRGAEYEAMKEAWKERMLDAFLKEFPKISRDSIEVAELGTALTNDYYLGTHRGAIYGLGHTPARYASDVVNPRTPIANLFLSGQDALNCGIVAATYSGFMTAAIVEPRVQLKLEKILARS
ncbi:hypothetical protein AeMF1_003671 [Aphanomyces euteiches]|nr:hypothetical protein AeMF1_003671 [Aphanomyces euteiches]KAH9189269.1 hypothetical protein AeNC1_008756 [Aphanomyces euteiches]